ncbi:DUF2808 domain-containing protein [Crocosphaera sp. XPORK-15E]|uniref:DUF2808 domain-containing protein n=1 Tax=Crocosphaera sp. XPORK-15E TaxID=3110247 RepID=UPI002B1F8A4E|nr:DUF2808 domain-containing protein [Crocosphaera sp. XPORK-15E]MEA5532582.1 DUF2808 domain-containing protein [Crocosphaera sp. XPORK-15E]
MRIFPLIGLTLILGSSTISLATDIHAQDLPLSENNTFFTGQPPSLTSASSVFTNINVPDVPYLFTINLPKNSVESLGKVTVEPNESSAAIDFQLDQTKGFQGTENNRGKALTLKSVTQDSQTKAISVVFEPPIPPGTNFTISLIAAQNPSIAGTYLFTVKAFPSGNNPTGIDLGVGTFRIYEDR